MKAEFNIPEDQNIIELLEQIAVKFGTSVKKEDEGEGHYIFIRGKINLHMEPIKSNFIITTYGTKQEDVDLFTSILGEPSSVKQEPPTLIKFAQQLINIPDVNSLNKQELMTLFELEDKIFLNYQRMLKFSARRSDAKPAIKKALEIMEKF